MKIKIDISLQKLQEKDIVIYGPGKVQRDFEYVFDAIKCKYYIVSDERVAPENKIYSVSKVMDEDLDNLLVIVCLKDDSIETRLTNLGLEYGKNFVWVDDLLFLLDAVDEDYVLSKNVYIWGCGATQKNLELALSKNQYRFEIKGYVDSCSEKWNGIVISPKEFSEIENSFVIVASIYYDDIKEQLEGMGKVEGEDFICYTYFMARPSLMLRETMYAKPIQAPRCRVPFERMTYTCFGMYPCCVSWIEYPVGNPITDSCEAGWNSIVMKLYRLSMENRTYSFCKKGVCKLLAKEPRASEKEEFVYEKEYSQTPELLVLGLDDSCNLYCESCRKDIHVARGKLLEERKKYASKLVQSGWLEQAREVFMSVDGEVFMSEVDRMVLYGEAKRDSIHVLTNGNLLDYKQFVKLEQTYNRIWISISVDAATEETYKLLRRGGNWKRLQENFAMLAEQRLQGKIDCIDIRMVVQRKNYKEIPAFIDMARKYHFDKVIFSRINNYGTYTEEEYENIAMITKTGLVCDELEGVLESICSEGVEVDIGEFLCYRKKG